MTIAKYHLVYWLNWIIRTSGKQIIFKQVHLNLDGFHLKSFNFEVVNQNNKKSMIFAEVCGAFTFKTLSTTLGDFLNASSLTHLPITEQFFYFWNCSNFFPFPEWKWGSWVAVRDSSFQWILKTLWHWQLCKSNNIFEVFLCFPAGIFKQIFFILHLIWGHHSELLLLSRRVLAEAIMAWI